MDEERMNKSMNFDNIISFLELYVYNSFFLICLIIIFQLIIILLQNGIWELYFRNRKRFIYRPQVLIRFYKVYKKLYYFLSVLKVKPRYYNEKNIIYKALFNESLFTRIVKFIGSYFILSKFAIINMLITLFEYFGLSFNKLINLNYFELVNNLINQVNLNLKILPSIILGTSVIYIAYYLSIKSKFKAAINISNKERFKDIINIHRELYTEIYNLIYYGSENINRALEIVYTNPKKYSIKDMIVDLRMSEISSNIYSVDENEIVWIWDKSNGGLEQIKEFPLGFEEIECIQNIGKVLNQAVKDNKYDELVKIAMFNHDGFNFAKIKPDEIEDINKKLLTKSGIERIINIANDNCKYEKLKKINYTKENYKYYENEIIMERNRLVKIIDDYIIEGIELIVDLTQYVKLMDKLLYKKQFIDWIGVFAGYKE